MANILSGQYCSHPAFREESDVWVRANLPLGPLTENCSRSPSASMRKIYNDKGADSTPREAEAYFDFTSPEKPATARRLKAQPMTDRK